MEKKDRSDVYCPRMMERIYPKGVHVYTVNPIDFFEGAIDAEEWICRGADPHDECTTESTVATRLEKVTSAAFFVAKTTGWEGDGGAYICAIPSDNETEVIVIFKQEHSGTTFIVSPVELPHLEPRQEDEHVFIAAHPARP